MHVEAGNFLQGNYDAVKDVIDGFDTRLRNLFLNRNAENDETASYTAEAERLISELESLSGLADNEKALLASAIAAFEAGYALFTDGEAGFTAEEYVVLKNGLVAERIDELSDMRDNNEINEAEYYWLTEGKILVELAGSGLTPIDPDDYPMIDISKLFGDFGPSLTVEIGATDVPTGNGDETRPAFLLFNLNFATLLTLQMEIGHIEITVEPDETYYNGSYDEFGSWQGGLLNPTSGYYHLDPLEMENQNIILNLNGELSLVAEDTVYDPNNPDNNTAIDFGALIQALFTQFFGGSANFGAILENNGYDPSKMTYEIGVILNMHDLLQLVATGDINYLLVAAELKVSLGFEVEKQVIDTSLSTEDNIVYKTERGIDYLSLYYVDGSATIIPTTMTTTSTTTSLPPTRPRQVR